MFFCWLFAEKYFFSNVLIHSWFFILVDLRLAETSFNWTNCFLVGCTRWLWFTGPSCRRSSSSCCSSVVDVAFYLVVVVALIHRELSIMLLLVCFCMDEVFVECVFLLFFIVFVIWLQDFIFHLLRLGRYQLPVVVSSNKLRAIVVKGLTIHHLIRFFKCLSGLECNSFLICSVVVRVSNGFMYPYRLPHWPVVILLITYFFNS